MHMLSSAIASATGTAPITPPPPSDERAVLDLLAVELAGASRPCVTSSFQAGGVVLLHLLRQVRPEIPVLFLDTVHHFGETLRYRDEMVARLGLNLVVLRAEAPAPGLWQHSLNDCCQRHKVDPLFTALPAYDLWFAAVRRQQAPTRAAYPVVESFALPGGSAIRKVSPLAAWTRRDLWAYARRHDLPLLKLYELGYTSIGCEPCTAPPTDPSNERSGRWGGQKIECGIHLSAG
jgi:phosphoadenosine phosphosulfate reductase